MVLRLGPSQQEDPKCARGDGTAQSKTEVQPRQGGTAGSLHTDLWACPWGWSWPAGHGTTGGHLPPCSASCCSWSSSGGGAASCRSQSHDPGTSWHLSLCCHARSWGRSRHPHHFWENGDNAPSILEHLNIYSKDRFHHFAFVFTSPLEPQFPHLRHGTPCRLDVLIDECHIAWKEILPSTENPG